MADDNACAICLLHLGASVEVCSATSCGHIFHNNCIQRWRRESYQCPVCRTPDVTCIRLFHNFAEDDTRVDRSEVDTVKEQLRVLQEAYDMLATQHDLQVRSLHSDSEHWHAQFNRVELEAQELRRAMQQHQGLQKELDDIRVSKFRLQQQFDSLLQEAESVRRVYSEVLTREGIRFSNEQSVTIRNLTVEMIAEPHVSLKRILRLLRLTTPKEHYVLHTSSMMEAKPDRHQLRIKCHDVHAKIELLVKFTRLQENSDEILRSLQIKDSRAVTAFYKWSNQFILGQKGVKGSRLLNDQVLIKLSSDTAWRELENEEQVRAIAAEIARYQAETRARETDEAPGTSRKRGRPT